MPARSTWLVVAGWLTLSRLAIFAVGVLGVATFIDQSTMSDPAALHTASGLSALNPETAWHRWDVLWYERIAVHGYAWQIDDIKGQAAAAFFPLYPLLVGVLLKALPGLSFFWVASALSNALSFLALGLFVRSLASRAQVDRFLLVFLTAAGSFYLSIPYTEGLFLLFVVGVLLLTRRGHYAAAALVCGLAAVTRIQGLALIAVPVAHYLQTAGDPVRRRVTQLGVMLILFAWPLVLHMTYLANIQGSPFAFVGRQAMWDNAVPYPLKAIVALVEFPRRLSGWLHGGYWMLYAALLARYWRRLPVGEWLFCAGAMLISTQQDGFHGIYRYVVPLVPLLLAIADDENARLRGALIGLNLTMAVLMILAFVTNNRLAL